MSELVERVALIIEASVERHGGGGLDGTMDDARAAIAEVMDWMAEPGHDATEGLIGPTEDRTPALRTWRHMLSAMRKEALGE